MTFEEQLSNALDAFWLVQVAYADPDFWDKYGIILTGQAHFPSRIDQMDFETNIYHQKLQELREAGKISEVQPAVIALEAAISALQSPDQLLGMAQKLANDMLPKNN